MSKAVASVAEPIGMIERDELRLPFTVIRRLTCVLGPTKEAVLAEKRNSNHLESLPGLFLLKESGTFLCALASKETAE
ncbi:hypothetical protein F1728_04265 [Gimesia benthica]|uniref:Uncharacterized protein n=1 Tax=Gimesia benthica TaxID=2608982 RepID=A0A6I6AA92_9PLAN|nr:hypothetical protein F1728_04265 [Gimesia benthica]